MVKCSFRNFYLLYSVLTLSYFWCCLPTQSLQDVWLALCSSRTARHLLFGGKQRIQQGLSKGLLAFLKDWKSPYGALETGSSLAIELACDTNLSNPALLPAMNSALACRMFLPGYQDYRLKAHDATLAAWLVEDICIALQIFGGFSVEQSKKIVLKPLDEMGHEPWGRVCMLWIGIVPTNDALYVDQDFLEQFRSDPLMYGFLLAHGIYHYKQKTFSHRAMLNLAQTALRTVVGLKVFALAQDGVDKAIQATQANVEYRAPSLALWNSVRCFKLLSDTTQDTERSWSNRSMLYAARCALLLSGWFIKDCIAEVISSSVMELYSSIDIAIKKRLITLRVAFDPHFFVHPMSAWLQYYQQCCQKDQNEHYKKAGSTICVQKNYSYEQRVHYVKTTYLKPWLDKEQDKYGNEFRCNLFKHLITSMDRWRFALQS